MMLASRAFLYVPLQFSWGVGRTTICLVRHVTASPFFARTTPFDRQPGDHSRVALSYWVTFDPLAPRSYDPRTPCLTS
jgi:hypothetical protein